MLIDFLDHADSDVMYLVATSSTAGRSRSAPTGPTRTTTSSGACSSGPSGTEIVYIPGNHDEMFRQFSG